MKKQLSMSTGSTGLPSLERLFLDADVNEDVGAYLKSVGFDAVLARQSGVDLTSDLDVLRHSRDDDRILVCHDKHRDRHTLLALLGEICNNGGKVIRIGGVPGQSPITSAGLIMVHRRLWRGFFEEHQGGIVIAHFSGCRLRSPPVLQEDYRRRTNAIPGELPG